MGSGDAPGSYAKRLMLVRRSARGVDCCQLDRRSKHGGLGALGSHRWCNRLLCATRRVLWDTVLQQPRGSPSVSSSNMDQGD
jgi:hypothetical protein